MTGLFSSRLCLSERSFNRSQYAIKLAIVDGRKTLIYHRNADSDAARFVEQFARRHNYQLLQDRRCGATQPTYEKRGRNGIGAGLILLACTTGLHASADVLRHHFSASSSLTQATQVRVLNLFSTTPFFDYQQALNGKSFNKTESRLLPSKAAEFDYLERDYQNVHSILMDKWRPSKSDPESIHDDLNQLARYIASQPQVLTLLESLANTSLRLRYKSGEFKSVVKGSRFFVRSVTVYFDTRKAAALAAHPKCGEQIAYCVASPADALIHELLHAQIALLDSDAFLASGGLSSVIYPFEHERQVLNMERQIYRQMSDHDHHPRPVRRSHAGQLVNTSCVTCTEAQPI